MDKEFITFISAVSEIRNEFVHKIGNVGSKLDEYLASLNKDKRNNFYNAVLMGTPDPMEIGGKSIPVKQFILENPVIHIWMISMYLLGYIYLAQQRAEMERSYTEFATNFTKGNLVPAMQQAVEKLNQNSQNDDNPD